jgi:hypothetical protein
MAGMPAVVRQVEPERRNGAAARAGAKPTDPTLFGLGPRQVAIRLFVTCWLVYALHFATNTVREIYPALSLGDRLSFDVSEYVGLHPDIFELPGRGAFINNNPGASILGAAPYALARPVIDYAVQRVQQARAAPGAAQPEYDSIYPLAREFYRAASERGLDVKFGLGAGAMQVLLMAPLSALSAVVMFWILFSLTGSPRAGLLLALLYAFATPVFYRTAQLNHNLLLAHSAFFAFALLWRPWIRSGGPGPRQSLLAGLLAGWTVVLDYTGVVVLAALGAYALARWWALPSGQRRLRALVLFGAGAAASLSVLAAYQWLAFGNPLIPAQRYMPPTAYSQYGYNGMGLPRLDLLWETAFGPRFGLFTSAPLLLLALVPTWLRPRGRLVGTRELWLILGLTLATFVFTAANQFAWLQFNSGVRHVVPAVPFVFLLAAGVLARMPVPLAAGVGVVGVYWSWCLAMYRDVEQGLGVLESLIHVTLEGPRLPWLTTLERMGYAPPGWAPAVLAVTALAIAALWLVGPRGRAVQAMRERPNVEHSLLPGRNP